MTLNGADISGWQPPYVNMDGKDFVIVKSTQGTVLVNANHDSQVAEARSKNCIVGHYHFPNWGDPRAEAEAFWNLSSFEAGDFAMLDIESSNQTPWPADPVGWTVAFNQRFAELSNDTVPLQYTNLQIRKSWDWTPNAIGQNTGCVDAEWNPNGPSNVSPWPFCAIWQNADTDQTGGDSDIFFGDRTQLEKYGYNPNVTPAPAPVPEPVPEPVPVPAPAPVNPNPPSPSPTWDYTIVWGDTLSAIAARFNVTLDAVESVNPQIPDYNKIWPGEIIHIPTGYSPAPHRQYVVQSGDTLSAIAASFGVSLDNLIAANPQIADPNLIYPGQMIVIP